MTDSTAMYTHHLAGCRATPLAHYLKALGVLRLIGDQADPDARGWWCNQDFFVGTRLDRVSLERFFLSDYMPTPLLAPWNGGSGFYPSDNHLAIDAIVSSAGQRLAPFREAIAIAKDCVSHLDAKPQKGDEKNAVILSCQRRLRGAAREWMDSALAIATDGEPVFPALLGTGGNDGRLDFTVNFMQRIVSMFDVSRADAPPLGDSGVQLQGALWSSPTPCLGSGAIGQFLPGAVCGPNSGTGFHGAIGSNPWDFVLMLEGCILFAAGLARRCEARALPHAAAPFAVRNSGSGYGSCADSDVGSRGEQWMPLWNGAATKREVRSLLREGRAQIGRRPVQRGSDMARAIARLGVARGIDRFQRFGYLERNGQSNLAVPIGMFAVESKRSQMLLDEVDGWAERLRRLASDRNAPQSMSHVWRACETAIFNCARRASAADFQSLLVALGQAEDQLVRSPKWAGEHYAKPLPRLSRSWLEAAGDNSAEWRLALALAAQSGPLSSKSPPSPIRVHWVPIDSRHVDFVKSDSGLRNGLDQCAIGKPLERALRSVLERRMIALSRGAGDGLVPLRLVHYNHGARLQDIDDFLSRRVDDARLLALARGLMSVDSSERVPGARVRSVPGGLALFGILRLALPSARLTSSALHSRRESRRDSASEAVIRCDPTIFRRLAAGDLPRALAIAGRRLRQYGIRPRIGIGVSDSSNAKRLAASLAFPLALPALSALAAMVSAPDPGIIRVEREQTDRSSSTFESMNPIPSDRIEKGLS